MGGAIGARLIELLLGEALCRQSPIFMRVRAGQFRERQICPSQVCTGQFCIKQLGSSQVCP